MSFPIIPEINFCFWSKKNPYFSDAPLSKSIKSGLNYAKKGGLIDDVIEKIEFMSSNDLVSIIRSSIERCNSNSDAKDENFLRVFDLIQGWGGQMGRSPYVRPKNHPVRLANSKGIARAYRDGISELISGNIDYALAEWIKINFLGVSFASKHLYFWGRFSAYQNLPILDTRMKTILYLNKNVKLRYSEYFSHLNQISRDRNIDTVNLERAVFAFSSNWFKNDSLDLVVNPDCNNDEKEARRLNLLWMEKKKFRSKSLLRSTSK